MKERIKINELNSNQCYGVVHVTSGVKDQEGICKCKKVIIEASKDNPVIFTKPITFELYDD